jgi:MFS family permease
MITPADRASSSATGGDAAGADRSAPEPAAPDAPAWAPLRRPAFRWLWLGMLISSVGTMMQTVGAQWLLVDAPNAATLVSLVQVANTLPIMLLAVAGGVLADAFDRRWLLLVVQAYFFIVGVVLVVLTVAGQLPPGLLLAFTFALGAGVALQQPSWGATIPELVPRSQLRPASRLDLVNVNLSRAIGPALAGLVIAHLGGVPVVFALNALSVAFLASAVLVWRRPRAEARSPKERFLPALRAGGHYVWHEPVVRRLLLRAILFVAPAMAVWALLPLLASQRLGLGADGYGALFGALGGGAIVGALILGQVQARLFTNGTLAVGAVVYASVLAAVVAIPGFPAALVAMVFAGLAWMAVTSTLQAELQLVLPAWVRARGLSIYTVTFMGSNAAGALLWGLAADRLGLGPAMLLAAAVMLVGVVAGAVWPVPETDHLDLQPAVYWTDARLAFDPEPSTGPVLVAVHYTVAPECQAAFLQAMGRLRRSRLRTGGTRWELYRDGERPNQFVELFQVPSWEEHLRQHAGRLTETDREVEEAALGFSEPLAYADHLLPPRSLESKDEPGNTHNGN